MSRRKPSPAMVVSLIALFVALSGVGYAATNLEKNSVKSKHIKNGQVKTADLADGGVATTDLADGSVSTAKVAANAINSGLIADGTVGTTDLGDNSVNSAKVAADSLAAGDLANNAVTTSEVTNETLTTNDIATNAIQNDELEDGTVRGPEFAEFGTSTENFGTINTNSCQIQTVTGLTPIPDSSALDDVIIVTVPTGFAGDFSVQAESNSATSFDIKACNNSGANADPDGGGGAYRFVAIDAG